MNTHRIQTEMEIGTETEPTWHGANYRHLLASLEILQLDIARATRAPESGGVESDRALAQARDAVEAAHRDSHGRPALAWVRDLFGLSAFERDVLLLAAGSSLSPGFAAMLAAVGRPPSFELAFHALGSPHWEAAAVTGPLREWSLVELERSEDPIRSPIRIDERLLFFLLGVGSVDARLDGVLFRVQLPGESLPAGYRRHVAQIGRLWSQGHPRPVIQLCGADAEGKEAIAAAGCRHAGLTLFGIRAPDAQASPGRPGLLPAIIDRELKLSAGALLVSVESSDVEESRATRALVARVKAPVIVSSALAVSGLTRRHIRVDVPPLDPGDQRTLWRDSLGPAVDDETLDPITSHFRFGPTAIRGAATEFAAAGEDDPATAPARLWDICRRYGRARLPDLAQRIESSVGWDDLILPDPQKGALRQIAADVANRTTVHERWGFGAPGSRGLGLSALFYGESGTGKTLAAEVIANEVKLDLWRIDLSRVLDKYIGETEKNLSRIFDAAEESGAILLFDEADALFSKRSEVRDSVDRFANVEVAYLLQRMECYSGLAVLTTNLQRSIDTAFKRRIRVFVEFPFPGLSQRALIWKQAFPRGAPTARLNPSRLAQLNVPGGNIRNIALTAAFLAARDRTPIGMDHVLAASRSEYAKMERPLGDGEIAGWKE